MRPGHQSCHDSCVSGPLTGIGKAKQTQGAQNSESLHTQRDQSEIKHAAIHTSYLA